jgi:hypothetical protein
VATYHNGILGGFSGKVGNLVFSSWKGIPVIRSKPVRKNNNVSILQEHQRARFRMLIQFLRPLTDLLNQTFQKSAVGMSCVNKAFSENKLAITGDYPSFVIDYSKIILSKGRLPLGEPPTLVSPETGRLLLAWRTGDGINQLLTAGSAFIAAYCEEFNRWIFGQNVILDGVNSFMLDVTPFQGKQVHSYIGFISGGRKKFGESRYMGQINILQ